MVQEGELALTPTARELGDSILGPDSISEAVSPVYGILLTPPSPQNPDSLRTGGNIGVSFILSGLFILFLIIALRFRNNYKYVIGIFRNLVETRTRQNVFDDTVNETTLIVLLNALWCACAGVTGYIFYQFMSPATGEWQDRAVGMLLGMAVATVYAIFMWGAYWGVGWVFSDRSHAALWVKGYAASQALMAPAFFVISLIGICNPETAPGVAGVAITVFVIAKVAFIWKGYKIFFNQFSSWVLFLCYLCSLEIVPLVLCYRGSLLLGEVLG